MNNGVTKEYFLTDEQIEFVKIEWNKEYQHHGDGCLCGYYECYIENIGYLIIETHCRKSGSTPDGMSWVVDKDIQVWSESLAMWGYVPDRDELEGENLQLLGYIEKSLANKLREIVRKSIIRDYSPWGHDEFGNDSNDEMCENDNTLYTLKEIKEAFKESEITGKDVFDILKEN